MFSPADSRKRTTCVLLAVASLALIGFSGCYDHHECGMPEECNFADDDCDRRIDEDFVDDNGVYFTDEHCGGCGVNCAEVFPTASETACELSDDELSAQCVIVACPEGFHRSGDGSCAPDVPVQCLACEDAADCEDRLPGSSCVELPGSDQKRCLVACPELGCDPGFECNAGICVPLTGRCDCTELSLGAEIGCLVERDPGYSCAGAQICTEEGFSECEPALDETCNEQDDDCDGEVDETFRDEEGRYVDRLHCGGCAIPCVEPGENMEARCEPRPMGAVQCVVECLEGFVDVDGILANGCECERFDGSGPPPAIGGDTDCDGVPDVTDDFIYVTTTGSDTNPGTLEMPMRTLAGAIARAARENKDVLVARGVYDGAVELSSGVSLFGGYRPDFRDRDLTLFPVVLEHRSGEAGAPVLTCRDIGAETRVEGFTIEATDATEPGSGSTAILLDGCSQAVSFAQLEIRAGRGADGIRGRSSSDNLAEIGASLDDLDGIDGTAGAAAPNVGICRRVSAGGGGAHSCPAGPNVSGGAGGDADCPAIGCFQGRACGNAGCTDFTSGGVCDFDAVLASAVPNPAAQPGRGPSPGSAGERTYNAPTNRRLCNFCDDNPTLPRIGQRGEDGASGVDGTGGLGCDGGAIVDLVLGRLRGGDGTDGAGGTHGSGGGGGSPGAGYAVIGGTEGECSDRSGGAGGGGGSGGCGAPEGEAGSGGGTSVAVLVRLAPGASSGPAFEDVRVVTASGGSGGPGGQGAAGGAPGAGANGGIAAFWCARVGGRGGDGGRGGIGGGGGGGCGGGAHGFVLVSSGDPSAYATALEAVEIDEIGVAGAGGNGGFAPGASGGDGLRGGRERVLVLPE